MKYFSELITRLDQSNKTGDKVDAWVDFFEKAADKEKVWAVAIFSHRRPKSQVSINQLSDWCQQMAGISDWLFENCYHAVGDLAETIALLLPKTTQKNDKNLGQ